VNGWNDTEDNNSGKTVGLTGTFTTTKFAWTNTYYGGPENTGTNTGWRQLYDTVLLLTPNSRVNAYFNFRLRQNRQNLSDGLGGFTPSLPSGMALRGALHFQPTSKWAFTPRVEWFKDSDGFSTGTAQDLKEFTLTGEYKMLEGFFNPLRVSAGLSRMCPSSTRTAIQRRRRIKIRSRSVSVAFFGPKR